ncbi:MAG: hypothetical protein OEY03_08300 [Rhizobacter sp.]|nr:hypothetical protein [Rhizobacter sp.]
MVDHDVQGQAVQPLHMLRQLPAVEQQLHMPAEGLHARDHRVEMRTLQGAAGQHVKAHAAHAKRAQALQLGVVDVGRDHHHAACLGAETCHRVEHAAIVVAMEIRLHESHALQAQRGLQLAVRRGAGPRRPAAGVIGRHETIL